MFESISLHTFTSVCHVIIFNMFTSIICIIMTSSFCTCFHVSSSCLGSLVEYHSHHVSGFLLNIALLVYLVHCGTSLTSCLGPLWNISPLLSQVPCGISLSSYLAGKTHMLASSLAVNTHIYKVYAMSSLPQSWPGPSSTSMN